MKSFHTCMQPFHTNLRDIHMLTIFAANILKYIENE